MAVRVPLELKGPAGTVRTSAVLNGGFEVPEPHLLLPAGCAESVLGDYARGAQREELEAAGGDVTLLRSAEQVVGRVCVADRIGPSVDFRVFVSSADTEVLVSDGGIDALGLRVESFVPGRWRFADEKQIRGTAAPAYW